MDNEDDTYDASDETRRGRDDDAGEVSFPRSARLAGVCARRAGVCTACNGGCSRNARRPSSRARKGIWLRGCITMQVGGAAVGTAVGAGVGAAVGAAVGVTVGRPSGRMRRSRHTRRPTSRVRKGVGLAAAT